MLLKPEQTGDKQLFYLPEFSPVAPTLVVGADRYGYLERGPRAVAELQNLRRLIADEEWVSSFPIHLRKSSDTT